MLVLSSLCGSSNHGRCKWTWRWWSWGWIYLMACWWVSCYYCCCWLCLPGSTILQQFVWAAGYISFCQLYPQALFEQVEFLKGSAGAVIFTSDKSEEGGRGGEGVWASFTLACSWLLTLETYVHEWTFSIYNTFFSFLGIRFAFWQKTWFWQGFISFLIFFASWGKGWLFSWGWRLPFVFYKEVWGLLQP